MKETKHRCNHCNNVTTGCVSCLLSIGRDAFKAHRFCKAECLTLFVGAHQGSQAVTMRDLKLMKKFK